MTLVLCPSCERHVEHDAKRCPHCGRTKPFPYRLVIAIGVFLLLLVLAGFSGTVAEQTMPRDLYAGTAKACVGDVTPALLDDVLPDFDWSEVTGRCRPTWYKAFKYGFPKLSESG
jgi:hypothetical protein